jgi:hypothetical protein
MQERSGSEESTTSWIPGSDGESSDAPEPPLEPLEPGSPTLENVVFVLLGAAVTILFLSSALLL